MILLALFNLLSDIYAVIQKGHQNTILNKVSIQKIDLVCFLSEAFLWCH